MLLNTPGSHISVVNRWNVFLFVFVLIATSLSAQPVITGISPAGGPKGSTVVINGTGFSATPADNTVYFGGVNVAVSAASATSLSIKVPVGFNVNPLSVTTNGRTAYAPAPFAVTFAGGGAFNEGSFKQNTDFSAPGNPYNIATGDLDGDGKAEMVTANYAAQTFSVFKNASTPESVDFSNKIDFPAGINCSSIAIADIDGDGMQDVVTGSFSGRIISVYRNTSTAGNVSFAQRADITMPGNVSKLCIGEIDGDGRPDIVIASDNFLAVSLNTSSSGASSFQQAVVIYGGSYVLAIGDVNDNGKTDLVSETGNDVLISNNTSTPGNVSFDNTVSFNIGYNPIAISIGNLDNDNRPDLAVVLAYSGAVSVLKNTGAGNTIAFASPLNLSNDRLPQDIQIADMNGDGKQDIVCSDNNYTHEVSVFRNTGGASLSFDDKVDYHTAGYNLRVAVADYNIDGKLDIATINGNGSFSANAISVLINNMGALPVLSSFNPKTGGEGTIITIIGNNLAGATGVTIGGIAAVSFNVVSNTTVTAVVGQAGATGDVSVTTPAGVTLLPGFVYTIAPKITSVTPTYGPVGQRVKIAGSHFSKNTDSSVVYFGAARATVISATDTTLFVTVPAGATYQPVSVAFNGYTVYSRQPFNITFTGGALNSSTFIKGFTAPVLYEGDPNNVTLADIDGDGKTDIVVNAHGTAVGSSTYQDSIAVYRNTTINGVISFAPRVSFKTTGNHTKNVSFADFDGDGRLDIIALNEFLYSVNGSVNIFRNNSTPGNISLSPPVAYNIGVLTTGIAIGDLDNDGKPDFSVADGSNTINVFRNTSTQPGISFNELTPLQLSSEAGGSVSSYIGDVDGDGKADVIAAALGSNSFSIFRNISGVGNISFAARTDINASHHTSFVTMGDVDGDGIQDLVLGAGYYNNYSANDSIIIIIRNLSTPGTFSFDPGFINIPVLPFNVVLTDLDGDNKPDLVSASANSKVFNIVPNKSTPGSPAFAPPISKTFYENRQLEGAACGDLDGDGKPDIVMADESSVIMSVLINQNGSDKSFCPNGSASITAGITGTAYQWQVSTGNGFTNIGDGSNYSGTATSALNLVNIPSAWYGYQYRCAVNAKYSKVTTIKFANNWTGAASSSWNNPANWSCGTVPDINTNVTISSGTVVVDSNVSVRSLKLDPDVSFTVGNGYSITITH